MFFVRLRFLAVVREMAKCGEAPRDWRGANLVNVQAPMRKNTYIPIASPGEWVLVLAVIGLDIKCYYLFLFTYHMHLPLRHC